MAIDPGLLDDLEARGLLHDTTNRQDLAQRLKDDPITVYYGVDPTAKSLHVGNLVGLLVLARFQRAGHVPLPLAGGATGMIGDPSGKSSERNLLSDDDLADNLARIIPTLRQFVDFEAAENPAKLLDNRAWTVGLPTLDFLRDVGKHITVNQMVAKESVRNRMEGEEGISFTEFSYMLLQAHDFAWLYENEGCELQIGGSDQWGNISLGVDLVRRRTGGKAHGLTWPLLVRKDGTKYGKTAGGETIWLSPEHMSPYRFYQSWIQAEDAELDQLLLKLTFMSVPEVDEAVATHAEAPHLRVGQKLLAAKLTDLVHGKDATCGAQEASDVLFGGAEVAGLGATTFEILADELESRSLPRYILDEPDNLIEVLTEAGVVASKGEGGRLVKQNGVSVNGVKVDQHGPSLTRNDLHHDRYCLVWKGKKSAFLLDFAL